MRSATTFGSLSAAAEFVDAWRGFARDDRLFRSRRPPMGERERIPQQCSARRKRAGINEVLLPADNEPNVVADLNPEFSAILRSPTCARWTKVLEHALKRNGDAAARAAAEQKTKARWPG